MSRFIASPKGINTNKVTHRWTLSRLAMTSAMSVLAVAATGITTAAAQSADGDSATDDNIVVLGSRNTKPRSAADSPVPVDTISGEDFNSLANTSDLTDNLKALVPSFTASPATGDGSAFIRPTSLRGLAPDETLVLINGKRRHRTALVQLFAPAAGNGAHGADIGMIPGVALKRVEVLRDGASSQYGADAIAGVINFVTHDASDGGQLNARYGRFYQGEDSYAFSGNVGLPLGDRGYVNISGEYVDNDALSRGIQRPDAQALIDAGVQGVGADSPFGDAPLVQTWGRPQTQALRLFASAGYELSDNAELYAFGNFTDADGRYRFFYRNPSHPSIQALNTLGFTGLLAGYTPFLDGNQTDFSVFGGIKGVIGQDLSYDFSAGFGSNKLDYFLNNTLNPSLGLIGGQPAQRDFDVGALQQEEITLNADFSVPLTEQVNLAFGGEWREETFTVTAGEPNSFLGDGSNGFGGFKPEDSGAFDRSNYALYADLEYDISDDFLIQTALRYEDFTDFGDTLNWKVATRYNVSDGIALRASASTGFHAPTPGQSNLRSTITTFDGSTGLQTLEGLVPATSPEAIAVGGAPLKEEQSNNYSAGFTAALGESTNLTIDFYRIEVDDRIYRTGDIDADGDPSTSGTISFYTNALDIVSKGIDIVVTSNFDWSNDLSTSVILAANINDFAVVGQTLVGGIQPVSDGLVEDIENNYPSFRSVLTTNTQIGQGWNFMARANFYGSHFDERGRIGDAVNPTAKIGSTIYFDVELAYQVTDNLKFAAGGINVFDSFVDEIGPPNANRLSVGLQYPRRSVANYEGGSWYVRLGYEF
jgi:iron complex outermembrane recepter protein